jgi:hypothetical protein
MRSDALALVLVLSATACGSSSTEEAGGGGTGKTGGSGGLGVDGGGGWATGGAGSGGVGAAGSGGAPSGGSGGTGGTNASGGTGGTSGSGGTSSAPPPVNRYGIGLVNEGSTLDHDLAAKLAGPGGFILVIFADITPTRTSADPAWKQSISAAYARDLIPVIRMAPPWGNRKVRNMGESPTSYQKLAQAYKAVIQDLPLRPDWPLYVQVHNEPNLCYEWDCDASAGTLTDKTVANEYAHMLADVAAALHSIGDPRIKVLNGALAPGGAATCQCGTSNFTPGTLSATFLAYMQQSVPGLFDQIDAFAAHSYPAQGEGWGFFVAYPQSLTGLKYFEKELAAIGKGSMKVLITETGWPTTGDGQSWSRDQVADFTVEAVKNVWLTHPNVLGVTPFMLRDTSWDQFGWTDPGGAPYPVYTKVRAFRCAQPGAKNCN